MPAANPGLLLKFRKRDTQFGVTRETVKAMADRLGPSETEVVHMALARMAKDELHAYEADDGPLSTSDSKTLRKTAQSKLPDGRVLRKQSLF